MPRLWTDTIEEHRRSVREAVLESTAALVARHGLRSVTMSQIAQEAGIGRATLYKYFPDVESILVAWHEKQVTRHLDELAALADGGGSARERLEAVLAAYARIQHEQRGAELAPLLHHGAHVARAREHLGALIRSLISEGAQAGELRSDVAPAELAAFCLNAVAAAGELSSKAAVGRLVDVTMTGLAAA